ncbi:MAG: 2-phosphosulfolactate phosphatase [Verrucomicrobia bacterium]|nr:2-phosphosulfolactate phosphatase [Verrucomicrobiota bacterium]
MRIDVVALPAELGGGDRSADLSVVVDVLRLSSTMVTAFANGCEAAIPVAEPAEALMLRDELPNVLLAGEREGYRIEGFDLGNSPFEMTRDVVRGRTLVMCSTNGTRAIVASRGGAESIVACFLNASAAARYALGTGRDVTVLCSGKLGAAALEDAVCAGMLVEKLGGGIRVELTDRARRALEAFREHADDLVRMATECEHGRYLTQIGMGRDVPYCAEVDRFDLVPHLTNGTIRAVRA